MTATSRPLVLDLLPATHGAVIHTVTCWDRKNPRRYLAAWLGADGTWYASNGDGHGSTVLDPADITEFTAHTGDTTTTYTEGADTNEWTATIRRKQS